MNNSLSIFMPFYNDAGTVKFMITEAYLHGNKLSDDVEVIAVNDGSVDDTSSELHKMKEIYPDLKIIDHPVNTGYGGALISGINNTSKNWVFYTDGDAQYHFDELGLFWNLRADADIINGYKLSRSDSAMRRVVGSSYSWLLKLLFKTPISDIDCDYRLIKGDLLRSLNLQCTSGAITIELVKKLQFKTTKFTEVGVSHYARIYGSSTFFTPPNIFKTFKDELKLLKEFKTHTENK